MKAKRRRKWQNLHLKSKSTCWLFLKTKKVGPKEINRVSFNGAPAKFDIRAWSPDHTKMGKGITSQMKNFKRWWMPLKETKFTNERKGYWVIDNSISFLVSKVSLIFKALK